MVRLGIFVGVLSLCGAVTEAPTPRPTKTPTTQRPTKVPTTQRPTKVPTTQRPTKMPTTQRPTKMPTSARTGEPVTQPTVAPTVPGTRTATSTGIAAGGLHTCALLDDGTVKCFGNNYYGQLGQGNRDNIGDLPEEMGEYLPAISLGSGRTATAIAAGGSNTCALLNDGTVKCFGSNSEGQLGQGNTANIGDSPDEMGDNLPTISLGAGRTVTAIAAGGFHTCALLDDGTVKCFGSNSVGQLGQGNTANIGDEPYEMGDNLPAISLGAGRTATAIAAGGFHTCVLLDDGTVKCFGTNGYGSLGQGNTAGIGNSPNQMGDNLPAISLGAGRTATAIAAGIQHTCALLDDGTVKCFGSNSEGQLGQGNRDNIGDSPNEMGDNLPAISLGTGRTATAIAAGNHHTCALLDDGTVKCFGQGSSKLGQGRFGNIGDSPNEMGDYLSAISLGSGRTATAIDAGYEHTCALLDDGTVKCFGANSQGQLGQGKASPIGAWPNEMGDNLNAISV